MLWVSESRAQTYRSSLVEGDLCVWLQNVLLSNLIAWQMFCSEDNHILGYDAVWSDRQKPSDVSETSGSFKMSVGSYHTTWCHILECILHFWWLLAREPQISYVLLHFKCCLEQLQLLMHSVCLFTWKCSMSR
jgi:hypothetical protein